MSKCGCSGLGSATATSAPRHLSDAETRDFLAAYRYVEPVRGYLAFREPPWGVTFQASDGRTYLVWFAAPSRWDGEQELHVVDVTGDPIIEEIDRAPYEAPGYVDILVERVREVAAGAQSLLWLGFAALGLYVASQVVKR